MSAAAGVEQKPRSQRSQVQNGPMNPKENVGDGDFDRYMQSNLPAHQGYSSAPSMPAPDSYMPTYYPSPYSISYSIPGSETTWSTGGDSFNNFNYTSYDSSYAQDYYNQPGTTPPYLNQSFNFFPTNADFMPGTWASSSAPAQPQGSARTQPQAQAQTPYYDYPRYQAGPNSVTSQRNYNQGLNGLDGQDGKAHGMKAMELGMSGLSIGAPIDKPGVNIAGREAVKQDVIPPKPQGPSFSQAVAGAGGAPQPPPQNTAAPKQTSWAAIVSKPAKPQPKKTTKTGSHAPVPTQLPTMKPTMTIGTWNNGEKGGAPAKPAGTATTMPSPPQSQAPPTQPPAIPPQQQQPPQQPPQQQQMQQPPQPQQPMPVHPQPQVQHVQPQPVAKIETPVTQPPPNTAAQAVSQQKPVLPTQEVPRRGPQAVVQPQPQQPRTWDSNGQQNRGGSNYGQRSGNQTSGTAGLAPISAGSGPKSDIDHPVLEKLRSINDYNPTTFNMDIKNSRIFVIKSYSEDDIHRSIKYGIWCSTEHGNKRLDAAFRERQNKGPIYLIYSVNGSGHFCGVAEMMSEVDYATNTGVWAQDKWKGRFDVRWIYVKDVPNNQLRHIRLENNDNKPVTNSRDTQEVLLDKGKQVMKIIHNFRHTTSIFDDFSHYEKRQEEDSHRRVGGHGGGHGGRRGGHRN